jgi:N-acyl-D-amino-acid deacylase
VDPRLYEIEVQHCLHHTAGWDRDKSFDPMGAPTAEDVAKALKVRLPIIPRQIIRYTMGKRLDFAPGTAFAYSNFGYCVLGRVIQAVSNLPYHDYVSQQILAPLGIRHMRLGKNLLRDRAPDEVKYYDSGKRTGRAISGPNIRMGFPRTPESVMNVRGRQRGNRGNPSIPRLGRTTWTQPWSGLERQQRSL